MTSFEPDEKAAPWQLEAWDEDTGPRNRLETAFAQRRFRTYTFEHVRYFGLVLEKLVYQWILEVYLWKWQITWVIGKTRRG